LQLFGFETKAHLCFSYFEHNVLKGQERPYLRISPKRQNGTVDPSLFSLHLIEGRVIPDWKKFISSAENIIRFLGDYIAKHILRISQRCDLERYSLDTVC
jgi:hypothetical protein